MPAMFAPALEYVLGWEDPQRQYAIVPDVGGTQAIAGINSGVYPLQYAEIASLPATERSADVALFYQRKFWVPMGLCCLLGDAEQPGRQDIANRVFDMGVNGGQATAIKLLQRSVNTVNPARAALALDGVLGPETAAAVNASDATELLLEYRAERAQHYQNIYAGDPVKYADDLEGWLNRAKA